jgi:hypothetical protein
MPIVALSVTEAELFAATCCAQDMLFELRVLESMEIFEIMKDIFNRAGSRYRTSVEDKDHEERDSKLRVLMMKKSCWVSHQRVKQSKR